MAIAFFDLDKTLLARNSAALWLIWELREGNVRLQEAAMATSWLLRYRMGRTDLEEPLRRTAMALKGVPEALWRARTRAFYLAWVRRQYRWGGLLALARHRAEGDRVVLLSSTHNHLADEVQADLTFDEVLCTRLGVDAQGVLTGLVDGPLCFGQGKLRAAEELCARWNVPLADCTFYTDSNADVPVLEKVGRPMIVNPDRILAKRAQRQGWPLLDWGRAAPWPSSPPSAKPLAEQV